MQVTDQQQLRVVGMAGFEPTTPSSRTKCSTRLSHIPKFTRNFALPNPKKVSAFASTACFPCGKPVEVETI